MIDVLGLGQCAYDRLLLVPRLVRDEEKVEGQGLTTACGGPVATALVALSRWGRTTAFVGVVGDDAPGRALGDDLAREGVDVTGLLVRRGHTSQQAFVAVEEGSGRRQILWQRPTGSPPRPDEVPAHRARAFLTDGLYAEASLRVAASSPLVVVDAGTMREGTRALLGHAHVFVSSEGFARDLVGEDDPVGACRRMREHGVEIAGVTLGDRGWVASFGTKTVRGDAVEAAVVDTTGCGDVFHAGLVEGLLAGREPERCFGLAARAAAACATRLGTRAGIPPRESLG